MLLCGVPLLLLLLPLGAALSGLDAVCLPTSLPVATTAAAAAAPDSISIVLSLSFPLFSLSDDGGTNHSTRTDLMGQREKRECVSVSRPDKKVDCTAVKSFSSLAISRCQRWSGTGLGAASERPPSSLPPAWRPPSTVSKLNLSWRMGYIFLGSPTPLDVSFLFSFLSVPLFKPVATWTS